MTNSIEPQDFLAWLAGQADGRTVAELSDGLSSSATSLSATATPSATPSGR